MSVLLLRPSQAGRQSMDMAIGRGADIGVRTLFDEIADPRERREFREVWDADDPATQNELARRFVERYPRSVLLREAYELAARAFVARGDLLSGLDWAKRALRLMPENPFLLVLAADVAVGQRDFGFAETGARDALGYLATADTAPPFMPSEWPTARDHVRGAAHRVLGRLAAIQGRNAEAALGLQRALAFNPADTDAAYILAVVRVAMRQDEEAAPLFARVMNAGGPLAAAARSALGTMYARSPAHTRVSFDTYASSLKWSPPNPPSPVGETPTDSRYAGSLACRDCHASEFERWQRTGMAKMLRPYRSENVVGDFSAQVVEGLIRPLIADGRHYVEVRANDTAAWRRYPVDYTIGSKWQQAYATRLPDGRVVVFPVQYNRSKATWINYWAMVDGPDSPRKDIGRFVEVPDDAVYQTTCAPCHTSQLRFSSRSAQAVTATFREGGVNCEMCHGPSLRHVESMSGLPSPSIGTGGWPFNFSRLSAAESVAICAQCHSQSAVHDVLPSGAANYSDGTPFYRAYATHLPSNFARSAFYGDGRHRATTFIVDAFVRSQCFRTGGATCASCHTPHPADASSNPTSLKFGRDADEMCLQCHRALRDSPERHTRHRAGTEASRCVSCHMPRIMDALLFPARTHEIDDVPDASMTARFGAERSPNACLSCHTDRDTRWLEARMAERR